MRYILMFIVLGIFALLSAHISFIFKEAEENPFNLAIKRYFASLVWMGAMFIALLLLEQTRCQECIRLLICTIPVDVALILLILRLRNVRSHPRIGH